VHTDPIDPRPAAEAMAAASGIDRHDIAVVLGSGWTNAADSLGEIRADVAIADLAGFLPPVAPGHAGRVQSTTLAGRRVLAFLGRTHLFEGHGVAQVAHAVRVAAAAGCHTVILTNANGSLRADWPPGTGVVISDHLNLTGMSPLVGPHFVDLTNVYAADLRALARTCDPALVEGVYAMLPGPHYETQAEARMLRALGADVLGMSTVLEAIAARAAGMRVLGLSVVTAVEIGGPPVDPDEVVRIATAAATRLGGTIARVVSRIGSGDSAIMDPAPGSPTAHTS
jgi:purine-nucleoside phosphorylase